MKKQLLILTMLFIALIGHSQTFTENFITYEVSSTTSNTVRVINYNPAGGLSVIVPNIVTYNSINYNVTSINDYAFENLNLVSITLPNSIITIGAGAFFINNITSVTIPDNVTSIGEGAFAVNPLTCIVSESTTPPMIFTFNNNLDTFAADRSNINLSIPTGSLNDYTNAGWTGFNSIAEGLSGTFVVDHITYEINATPNNEVTVIDYNTAGGTDVDIPMTVNSGCTEFTVTTIGDNAFMSKNLTSVIIPTTILHIEDQAFEDNNLTGIIIPNSVTTIDFAAFRNNNLIDLTIPNSVTNLGNYTFRYNNLTSVVISNNITLIRPFTFRNNNLTSVTIPDSVTSIDGYAFANNNLTTIIIPNSVTYLGGFSFANNQISDVILGTNLATMAEAVFGNSASTLTSVTSLNTTPPTITTTGNNFDSFVPNRSVVALHIPPGTMGAYVTDAGALWTGFNPVTEDALSVSNFELTNDIKVITTQDKIEIVSANGIVLDNYVVYNISGGKIKTGKESEISTTALASGIYILKLDFNRGVVTKKVIVN